MNLTIDSLCEELNNRKEDLKKKLSKLKDKGDEYMISKYSGRLDECDYMRDKFCK